MENIGLVTYRETALLASPNGSSTQSELQRVSIVVAHELAHQWFGDLVTMDWWSALFLNEGFASLTEYIGCDEATPQFEASRGFYASTVIPAMVAVQWAASRSLESPVDSSAQIESQFDGVAYSFGASLLQSTRAFMDARAPGSFFRGVGAYLRAHVGGNAAPAALWQALGDAGGLPDLPEWLSAYTAQTGFPIVTLAWQDPAAGEATGVGVLTVSQRRHFASPASRASAPPAQRGYTWWVPLTLLSGAPAGPGNPVSLAADAALASGGFTSAVWGVTIGGSSGGGPLNASAVGWIKANANASGFYRVNYPPSLWRRLAAGAAAQLAAGAAAPQLLTPLDRAQLLDDVFALAAGGTDGAAQPVDMPLALDVAAAVLPLETTPEAWTPALGALAALRGVLWQDDGTPGAYAGCVADANTAVGALLAPLVGRLGWGAPPGSPPEPPVTIALRIAALAAGSAVGLPSVLANASALFAAWAAAGGSAAAFGADLQPLVLANAVRWQLSANGTVAFDLLLARAAATEDAAAKRQLLAALAASRDRGQLAALLAVCLNASVVRSQDSVSVIAGVAGNPAGRDLAWAFARANWPELMARYGAGGFALSSLVTSTAQGFTTPAALADVSAWYAAHPTPGAALEAAAALEAIATRAGWRAGQLDATCAKLAAMAAAAGGGRAGR